MPAHLAQGGGDGFCQQTAGELGGLYADGYGFLIDIFLSNSTNSSPY